MSRCSFDIHVGDIVGSLIVGATLVMLRPNGNMDFEYLTQVLTDHQISYMHTVPSLLMSFFTHVQQESVTSALKLMRSLCSSGELFAMR